MDKNKRNLGQMTSKGDKIIIGIAMFMVTLALMGYIGTALYKPKETKNG